MISPQWFSCPLVQRQDIGLWIREWWFESTEGNAELGSSQVRFNHPIHVLYEVR